MVGAQILTAYHHRVVLILAVKGARHLYWQIVGVQYFYRHQSGGGVQHGPVLGVVKDT